MKNTKHTCCICNEEFEGWGNNPAPAKLEGVCCDECNFGLVLPIRMLVLEWSHLTDEQKEEQRQKLKERNGNIKVGDALVILKLKGEKTDEYVGRFGIITHIDDMGQLHGTWGGLAVIPNEDLFLTRGNIEDEEEESWKETTTEKTTC